MLKWLFALLLFIGVLVIHLWLLLFTTFPLWQYLALLVAELLLLVLVWRGTGLKKVLPGLWRGAKACAGRCTRPLTAGARSLALRLYWGQRLRLLWWLLLRRGMLRNRFWLWNIRSSNEESLFDRELNSNGRCLRAIGNDLFTLRLWEYSGVLVLDQQVHACSPGSGRSNPGCGSLMRVLDRLAVNALGAGRCTGVLWNIRHAGRGEGPWLMDLETLGQELARCHQRMQPLGHFSRHAALIPLIDHAPCAEELQRLLSQDRGGDVAILRYGADPAALWQCRRHLLQQYRDPIRRIPALWLPGKLHALLATVLDLAVDMPRFHGLGLLLPGQVPEGMPAEFCSIPVLVKHLLATGSQRSCIEPALRYSHSGKRLRRSLLMFYTAALVLCLLAVDRSLLLSPDKVDSAVMSSDEGELLNLHRTVRRLNSRTGRSWLPVPGENSLDRLEKMWKRHYLYRVREQMRRMSDADADHDYTRLLLNMMLWVAVGRGQDRVRNHDQLWVIQELCRSEHKSILCARPQILDDYGRWYNSDHVSFAEAGFSAPPVPPFDQTQTWVKIFSTIDTGVSPQRLCQAETLAKVDVLLGILERQGVGQAGELSPWPGLRRDIAETCRTQWQHYLQVLGDNCDSSAPPASALMSAARATRFFRGFDDAREGDELLAEMQFLEELPVQLTGSDRPYSDTARHIQRSGLHVLARLRQRLHLPADQAAVAPGNVMADAALSSAGEAYADFLHALRELEPGLSDQKRALELARLVFSTGSAGDEPVSLARDAVQRLRQQVAGYAWAPAVATLMQCRLDTLWQGLLSQAGREVNDQWRHGAADVYAGDHLQRLQQFYGTDGRLAEFSRTQLREFLDYSAAGGTQLRRRHGKGMPLSQEFLNALKAWQRLGGALTMSHPITVRLHPVSVNEGATRQPHKLELVVMCQDSWTLISGNYESSGRLHWQPQQCGDVELRIHVGSRVLKRLYPGPLGMLSFIREFQHQEREFPVHELVVSGGTGVDDGVRSVRISMDLQLPLSLQALLAAVRAGFPESPV